MNTNDIRWKQRLQNFSFALKQLEKAVNLSKERELNDLEMQPKKRSKKGLLKKAMFGWK
jgi:hypothetical protein